MSTFLYSCSILSASPAVVHSFFPSPGFVLSGSSGGGGCSSRDDSFPSHLPGSRLLPAASFLHRSPSAGQLVTTRLVASLYTPLQLGKSGRGLWRVCRLLNPWTSLDKVCGVPIHSSTAGQIWTRFVACLYTPLPLGKSGRGLWRVCTLLYRYTSLDNVYGVSIHSSTAGQVLMRFVTSLRTPQMLGKSGRRLWRLYALLKCWTSLDEVCDVFIHPSTVGQVFTMFAAPLYVPHRLHSPQPLGNW